MSAVQRQALGDPVHGVARPEQAEPRQPQLLRPDGAGGSGGSDALALDERLTAAVTAMVGTAATRPLRAGRPAEGAAVARARALLGDAFAEDIGADRLAAEAGCSRFALYRAFRAAYGMAPSDYQRLLRLRAARRLLARGTGPAQAAALSGFADQSHLHRWFVRAYGITPAAYRRAGGG
ncbi:helix-turn-helix domain-containing protein [Streptomyces sp. SBT349]|uniref:helix-turn-helix domain-containing protein n=1 Tax=Streptomyces sp. SBT349 TaxID=1580539 RepID=UPI003B6386BC